MAADHVDHRRPAALERYVQHVDPRFELEQLGAEMLERADAGRGVLQVARLLLRQRHQLLDRMNRQVGMDHDDVRSRAHHPDRHEGFDWIVGQLVEPGVDRIGQRNDEDGVAVGCRVGRQLGADHAAGAGAVVDDHLLAELLAKLVADHAADHVVAAAGRKRND